MRSNLHPRPDPKFCAKMEQGSIDLELAINRYCGTSWPCGHPRTIRNTHTVGIVAACKECRRARGLQWLNNLASKKLAEKIRQNRKRDGTRFRQAILAREMEKVTLPFDDLMDGVCQTFDMTRREVIGKSRGAVAINARSVIIRIMRDRGHSYPRIGRMLGGRDHATIMNSLDKFNWYCKRDPRVRGAYNLLKDREVPHEG